MPVIRTRRRETHVAVLLVALAVLMFYAALLGARYVLLPDRSAVDAMSQDAAALLTMLWIGWGPLSVAMLLIQAAKTTVARPATAALTAAIAAWTVFPLAAVVFFWTDGPDFPLDAADSLHAVALSAALLVAAASAVLQAATSRLAWVYPSLAAMAAMSAMLLA